MFVFVLGVLLALGVSFLCSLTEATLLSLTPAQVAQISAKNPALGLIWQRFKVEIEHPIAVILILNTAAHTIGASLAGAKFDEIYGDKWIWGFAVVFTFVMLQFTEILPKTLGVRLNREIAGWLARPLQALVLILKPLVYAVHLINRPLELKRSDVASRATIEEITALAGLAYLKEEISKEQEQIINAATRLSHLRVHDVLIPAKEVSFLSTSQSLSDALNTALIDSHTRFPVCLQDNRDQVTGYVNFKELVYFMRTNPKDDHLQGVIRPLHVTTPDALAADLLKVFVGEYIHIALVRDDAGKTVGIVTLEDLIEELVGDLLDEFDHLPHVLHSLGDATWIVGGGLPTVDLAARLGLSLQHTHGSVSSWLTDRLGHPPTIGDVYEEAETRFTVRRIRRGKVFEASVTPQLRQLEKPNEA